MASRDGAALEAAADRFAELGARLRAAMAYAEAADEHARAGRRSSALRARGRSAAHLDACEGARLAPVGEAAITVQLTRREREIATLAANGLSNQEIATRLSVGVRTVEGHLLRASTKLGVRRRGELAAALGRPPESA
jgi:DNA-binding NarL/FixJ family response regulator